MQIIDDDYDHWEFHNNLHLSPDYILYGFYWDSLFDMPKSEIPFPIKSQPLVEVDGPVPIEGLSDYIDTSRKKGQFYLFHCTIQFNLQCSQIQ